MLEQNPGQPHTLRPIYLSFGQQQRLVGFIPKERRVVELEEDEARGDFFKKKCLIKAFNLDVDFSLFPSCKTHNGFVIHRHWIL